MYSRADLSRTVAVVALFLTAISTNAAAREFRAADTQNEDYPTVQALHYMGRPIAEKGGGRLPTLVFHSRQLGEEKETIEQTRAGAIDLNRTNVLFRSIEHLQKVLDGPIGSEILGSFEPYGFVGLTFYDSGARSIYNSVRPVCSSITTDHYKYVGCYTLTEHPMSPEVLVMAQKAWQSLAAEDGRIFRDAAVRSSKFMGKNWTVLEERSRQQAKAAGVKIVTDIDRKPFEAAMAEIYAKVQRDPAAAALIERIRKVE